MSDVQLHTAHIKRVKSEVKSALKIYSRSLLLPKLTHLCVHVRARFVFASQTLSVNRFLCVGGWVVVCVCVGGVFWRKKHAYLLEKCIFLFIDILIDLFLLRASFYCVCSYL